jgi:HlyD family secretion protein
MNKATALISALFIGASTSFVNAQEAESVTPETKMFLGKVVPLDAEQVILEMAEWNGPLRFVEVAAHGSLVAKGQVLARLETRDLEKQLAEIEQSLESAWTRNDMAQARAELAEIAAEQHLHDAELAFEDARQAQQHWIDFEYPQNVANAAMSATRIQYGIDDSADELAQLEAMYTEDELTDATEEIVLMRSRRNLAQQKLGAKIAAAMRKFTADVSWPRIERDRRLAFERAEIALDNARRSRQVDRLERELQALERENSVQKLTRQLESLKGDLEKFVITAPRAGMLLHGGARQYHPGANAPRFEQYADGYVRRALFTVANPQNFGVLFHVDEEALGGLDLTQAATASLVAFPDLSVKGNVTLAPADYAGYNNMASHTLVAIMTLETTIQGLMPGMGVNVLCILK